MNIVIKISGDQVLLDKIHRFSAAMLNFDDAMSKIGKELGDGDNGYFPGQAFASQGGVFGIKWPTNKAKTKLYKSKHYRVNTTNTLIRTGEMRGSFAYKADKNSVEVSNKAGYFKYHQSSAPRHKMPYRPMMGINDDVKNIVKAILEADIKRKVEEF